MKKKTAWRQGDVILVPVTKIPDEATPKKGLTLALGEVTGHSHQITEGEGQMFTYDEKVFLKIQSEIGALTHEEHHKIELPAGDYEVIIQREYEPNGWRAVRD